MYSKFSLIQGVNPEVFLLLSTCWPDCRRGRHHLAFELQLVLFRIQSFDPKLYFQCIRYRSNWIMERAGFYLIGGGSLFRLHASAQSRRVFFIVLFSSVLPCTLKLYSIAYTSIFGVQTCVFEIIFCRVAWFEFGRWKQDHT